MARKSEFENINDGAVAQAGAEEAALSSSVWDQIIGDAMEGQGATQASGASLQRISNMDAQELSKHLEEAQAIPRISVLDGSLAEILEQSRLRDEQNTRSVNEHINPSQKNSLEYTQGAQIGAQSNKLDAAGMKALVDFLFDQESNNSDKIRALEKLSSNNVWDLNSAEGSSYKIRKDETLHEGQVHSTVYALVHQNQEQNVILHGRIDSKGKIQTPDADSKQDENSAEFVPQNRHSAQDKHIAPSKNEHVQDRNTDATGPKGKNFEIDASERGGKDGVGELESDRNSARQNPHNKQGEGKTDGTHAGSIDNSQIGSSRIEIASTATEISKKKELELKEKKKKKQQTEEEFNEELRKRHKKDLELAALVSESDRKHVLKREEAGIKALEQNREKHENKRKESSEDERSSRRSSDWAENLRQEAREKIQSPDELQQFLQDLEHFEKKAETENLDKKEIEKTLKHLSKLISARESVTTLQDRLLAARTFMRHLALPQTCTQGQHNTCNVTTLAVRNTRRNPSKMSEMLKSAILHGYWYADDRKKIKLSAQSLVPGGEESFPFEIPCERTFAMQVLSNVLINDITQRRMPPEFYTQEKPQSIDDSGERLRYADGTIVNKEAPAIHVEEMDSEQQRLTGESEFVIYNAHFQTPCETLISVNSAESLATLLLKMKSENRLPAVLYVDTRHKEFGGNGKKGNGVARAHVVSITDYDHASAKAMVLNQWGPQWNREYSVDELYKSTLPILS